MRIIIIFFMLSFSCISLNGQGIKFSDSSWEELLAEAKKENKLIFIDAYTTWCSPCKYMTKDVFTQEEVGSFYNENFINAKFDMEKGKGKIIRQKYHIQAFPTLLFIDGNAEVQHMASGSRKPDKFLQLGKEALDPNTRYATLKKRYENGDRDDVFLKKYVDVLSGLGADYESVAKVYLQGKNWDTEENMRFIFNYSEPTMESKLFQYTIHNKETFADLVGEVQMRQKIEYAALTDARKKNVDAKNLNAYTAHLLDYLSPTEAKLTAQESYLKALMYSYDPADIEKFKVEAQLFLAGEPDYSGDFYNSVAWEFQSHTSDTDMLALADKWVDKSINKDENYYNTDTKAVILYKLGNKKDALFWAQKAIQLGEVEGHDTEETRKLIDKINQL